MVAFGESSCRLLGLAEIMMTKNNAPNPTPKKAMQPGLPLAAGYDLLRFLVAFAVCFYLWAKWLFSPQMFLLPALPPVEVFLLLVAKILGLRLLALIPLLGVVLIFLDALEFRHAQQLAKWRRRLLLGTAEAILIHVVVWLGGAVLFFSLLAVAPGSNVKGKALSDPVVEGLMLFCGFLSLIVAGPVTATALAVRNLGLQRREGFPPSRLGTLNNTLTILLVPLLLLWLASGYSSETLRSFSPGANATAKESAGELVAAAREGRTESVRAQLRRGAPVNARDNSGATALMAAASNGHIGILQVLIAAGAEVNAKSQFGRTALMAAAGSRHLAIVRELLKARAEVNAQDADGRTALMLAASAGDTEITQTLLQAGAEVNATSASGDTALMAAARGGHTEVVRLLVKAGASLDAKDKRGKTALHMALAWKHADTAQALREASARQ